MTEFSISAFRRDLHSFASMMACSLAELTTLRVFLMVFVIPEASAFLWWMKTLSSLQFRGWINAEYLLLIALGILYPSWTMILILTGELTVALIEPVAHLYYFSFADAIVSFRYLFLIPPFRLLGYCLLLISYIVICAGALRLTLQKRRLPFAKHLAFSLLVAATLIICFDVASGRFDRLRIGNSDSTGDVRGLRLARMPFATLVWNLVDKQAGGSTPFHHLPSALAIALNGPALQSHPNIVLVLTESWGSAVDNRLNLAADAFYRNPEVERSYSVQTGSVPFEGATTAGENRELCGSSGGRPNSSKDMSFDECWPKRLARTGYSTLAVHGFTPTMYSRDEWYKALGFQQMAFLPQLEHDGTPICDGAFPGACDAQVAQWILPHLLTNPQTGPLFVHWVTLNSHLPVAAMQTSELTPICSEVGIADQVALCTWFSAIVKVHQAVAQMAVRANLRPTIFVVVGDHAPPFLRISLRKRFSQEVVPYVILIPRQTSQSEFIQAPASSSHH